MDSLPTFYSRVGLIVLVASTVVDSDGTISYPNTCVFDYRRVNMRRVTCDRGGMTAIPTGRIEEDAEIMVITAPKNNTNNLKLDSALVHYRNLRELSVTWSNIPKMKIFSFSSDNQLEVLNLSHNNLTNVLDRDYFLLRKLRVLNLSYNLISVAYLSPFQYLSELEDLSLANNRITDLPSRFSDQLFKLRFLDLSGNPLKTIEPDKFEDLHQLTMLNLSTCRLQHLQPLIYRKSSELKELDLSYNFIEEISRGDFRYLTNLRNLNLTGNNIKIIAEGTFDGCNFERLILSRNELTTLSDCAFCNATIHELDLSNNVFRHFGSESLVPIANTLRSLNLGFNLINITMIRVLIRPLSSLRRLSLAGMGLNNLVLDALKSNHRLVYLNLSRNRIGNVSIDTMRLLNELTKLDLSNNLLRRMHPTLLNQFSNMPKLTCVYFHGNPWACESCQIEPLIFWFRDKMFYRDGCVEPDIDDQGFRCATPGYLAGRDLASLTSGDIPPCERLVSKPEVHNGIFQNGITVSLVVITVLSLIITMTIIFYKRRGAVFYARERERSEDVPSNDSNNSVVDESYRNFKSSAIYTKSLECVINKIDYEKSPPPA